ncbi:MAG: HEAT repeat domain-containing protein [Planctomycetota bacterium]|nr:MAG: HEAT repeat domain-containing protein [Planctomycetota bacterium]
MSRRSLTFGLVMCLIGSQAIAADDLDVEALWTQWKAGDEEAYSRLFELGPETCVLAQRILKPEGEVFADWPDSEKEQSLLYAMKADAVPAIARAIDARLPLPSMELLLRLRTFGFMAQPAGDVLMTIAIENSGDERDIALRTLAESGAKPDYVIPELIRLLSFSGNAPGPRAFAGVDGDAWEAAGLLEYTRDPRARNALIRAARFHPNPRVREYSLSALRRSAPDDHSDAWVFVAALEDGALTGGAFGGASTVANSALTDLLVYPELPADIAAGLIQHLYKESYQEFGCSEGSVFQLSEAICRCPATDKYARELVEHKIGGLLDADAYSTGDDDEVKALRIAAAGVVLHWDPENRRAAEFLAEVVGEADRDRTVIFGSFLPDLRVEAARGLGRAGEEAEEWLPLLHEVMEREAGEPLSELAFASAWAIAQIDDEDEDCVNVLREAVGLYFDWLHMPSSDIERVLGDRVKLLMDGDEAQERLIYGNLEPYDDHYLVFVQAHSATVIPVLLEQAKSDEIYIRTAAAEALGVLNTSPQIVVPELVVLLKDPRARVRAASAKSLAAFGPAAVDAIPALEQATNDEYLTVQLRAEDALEAIRRSE